jgi:hypothetical protein
LEEENAKTQGRKDAKVVDLPQRSGFLVVDLPQRSWLFGRRERKDAKAQRRKEDRKPPASPSGPLARRGFGLRARDNPRTGKKAKKAWESNRGIRWAAGERSSGPEENGFFCEPMVRRKSLVEERVGLARALGFG